MNDTPVSLLKGWRTSFRSGAWYRRRGGWVEIVVTDDEGFTLILRRTERTFEDCIAIANEVLTREE
jgi:hypothetical protein